MARKLAWVLLAGGLCLAGCAKAHKVRTGAPAQDACTAIMERLHAERLPVLDSVELWDNQYGPGLKLTTSHYEIYTTFLEPLMLRTVPGFIESLCRPRPVGAVHAELCGRAGLGLLQDQDRGVLPQRRLRGVQHRSPAYAFGHRPRRMASIQQPAFYVSPAELAG